MNESATRALRPRERRRLAVSHRILEAAAEMVADVGFAALSIQRLAAALDYTPGALYRYFPSKDALVAELVVRVIDELGDELAVVASVESPPLHRAVALARRWSALAAEAPHRFGLVAMLLATPRHVLTDPVHTEPAFAAMLRAMRPLATSLAEAAEAGELSSADPVQRAVLLFAGVQGVLLLRKQARHAPELLDIDALYDGMLRALLTGWGATAVTLEGALSPPTPGSLP